METTNLAPTFKQLGQTLREALGSLSLDIVKAQSKETATALQMFRDNLAQFALEADKLSKQWGKSQELEGNGSATKQKGLIHLIDCI